MKGKLLVVALSALFCSLANAQRPTFSAEDAQWTPSRQAYFVDGYHGGIYGHYPMWVTQFMVDKLTEHPEWRIGIEIEPETWDTVKVKEAAAYQQISCGQAISGMSRYSPLSIQPSRALTNHSYRLISRAMRLRHSKPPTRGVY